MSIELATERCVVRTVNLADTEDMLAYYQRNKAHLGPWEPDRSDDFYTEGYWRDWIQDCQTRLAGDTGYHFVALRKDNPDAGIAAICNLSNVVRGVFQACHMGYSVDVASEGQGLAREVVRAVVHFAFTDLQLHRVMANYMPENERSGRLLEALGFEREGYAKSYLKISGAWRDHVLTAKINPNLSE